ncbi:hypothetical protein GCM10009536_22080 [Streptomyces thermocarboxydus]
MTRNTFAKTPMDVQSYRNVEALWKTSRRQGARPSPPLRNEARVTFRAAGPPDSGSMGAGSD